MLLRFVARLAILLLLVPGAASAFEKEVTSISAKLATDLKDAGKTTIAVVDFTDTEGNSTQLGRFLAEEFAIALVEAGAGLEVINRTHLKVIMDENDLGASGVIDPKTALQLGKITGVQVLITGTITDFGESVRLVVSALDSSTARVIRGSRGEIPKTQAIAKLMEAQISGPTGPTNRPTPPPPTAQPAGETYGSDGVSFAFHGCKRSGSKVTCNFLVTNEGEDRVVHTIAAYDRKITRIFDDLGNKYVAKTAVLGKNKRANKADKELIRGIPIHASFSFEGFADEATHISVMKVWFFAKAYQYQSFEIRDIAFSN